MSVWPLKKWTLLFWLSLLQHLQASFLHISPFFSAFSSSLPFLFVCPPPLHPQSAYCLHFSWLQLCLLNWIRHFVASLSLLLIKACQPSAYPDSGHILVWTLPAKIHLKSWNHCFRSFSKLLIPLHKVYRPFYNASKHCVKMSNCTSDNRLVSVSLSGRIWCWRPILKS